MTAWNAPGLSAGILAASLLTLLPPQHSLAAPALNAGLQVPALAETVACRNVRDRVLLPNGRFEYVTRQDCSADSTGSGSSSGTASPSGTNCRMERQRIVKPNGTGGYLSVQRCN